MASISEETPIVTLSAFRFTDLQEAPTESTKEDGAEDTGVTPKIAPTKTYPGSQPPFNSRRPEAYERMAADKPGQELAHDATIWQLYLEEADEHDQELVKSRHDSLDMLLLFAALFSAILTAFLMESTNLLQQDPADVSATLLLMIAQSQQRMELGLPPPTNAALVDSPAFVPSTSARWINGIWFTSLALSLSAALIAMLGKEWLTAYLSSRPRPPRSHALLRQARLEGLEGWWALHIIALLPSLLHTSLLLFSLGLVVYLWTMDIVIAAVIAAVIGVTSLFYAITAILGAVYEHCPFVTQISGYIKLAFSRYLRHRPLEEDARSSVTSVKDLQALLWLANHARDPAVVDCSYQALAGLHLQADVISSPDVSDAQGDSSSPIEILSNIPMQLNPETDMYSLFHTVAERFEKMTTNPLGLSATGGTNVARYTAALKGLFDYLRISKAANTGSDDHTLDVANKEGYSDGYALIKSHQTHLMHVCLGGLGDHQSLPSPQYVLSLLETLWSNNNPPFSANSYASVLTAQVELLSLAASSQIRGSRLPTRPTPGAPFSALAGLMTINRVANVIDIPMANPGPFQHEQLTELRASYSRSLCRISYLLWLYSERRIRIDTGTLCEMLYAVRTAAASENLNPHDSVSTHHQQRNAKISSSFRIAVPVVGAKTLHYDIEDFYMGPLGSLIDLLRMKQDLAGESLLRTRTAAVKAFSAIAPVLLQQVLQLDRAELRREFDFRPWPGLSTFDAKGVWYVAVRQMLLTLRYLGPRILESVEYPTFCLHALNLIFDYVAEDKESGYEGPRRGIADGGENLVPLLELMGTNEAALEKLSHSAMFYIIDMVYVDIVTDLKLSHTTLTPICFPPIIRIFKHANVGGDIVAVILNSMLSRIRDSEALARKKGSRWNHLPPLEYLKCFTQTDKGFSALADAAGYESHLEAVATAATEFTHIAAGRDQGFEVVSIELHTSAVPGFLDVVSFVADHCSGNTERQSMLLEFSQNAVDLLEIASKDEESREIITQHPGCNKLCSALKAIGEDIIAHERLEQAKRFKDELGIKDDEESTEGLVKGRSISNQSISEDTSGEQNSDQSSDNKDSSDEEGGETG